MPSTIKAKDFAGQSFFIGLDVHKKSWSVTIRTLGLEVAHFSQPADAQVLSKYLHSRYSGGKYLSAYEAGFCGTTPHEQLKQLGIENIIINPADLPQTDKQKKSKTDVHDSRQAARYLEAGVLRGIYIMPRVQQELRALYRLRESKIKDVTRANNRLKSFLYYFAIEFPSHLQDRQYLSNAHLNWLRTINTSTAHGTAALQHYIDELVYHRNQVLSVTKKLKSAIVAQYGQQYKSALSVPGIGPIAAMALLIELGDLSRFDDPDEYCSYLGLAPSERSSGETVYSVTTQPRCNKHLRPMLIEAAWVAIRKCPYLLSYYRKHVARNNKKAIIKVAAKLALIVKSVAINQSTYKTKE